MAPPNHGASTETAEKIFGDVTRMARVPSDNEAQFHRMLARVVARAKKDSAGVRGEAVSASALDKHFFAPTVREAEKLQRRLARIQGDQLTPGEAARWSAANHFFVEALQSLTKSEDYDDPVGHLVRSLNLALIINACRQADNHARAWLRKPGRKIGTKSRPFNMFVSALLASAHEAGGRLTIYKSAYKAGSWDGSLLRATRALSPLLPNERFLPASKPGNALNTAYQRWRRETIKPRKKKV
jgi:hypothetical protein